MYVALYEMYNFFNWKISNSTKGDIWKKYIYAKLIVIIVTKIHASQKKDEI
jgi:hypothetical protein